MNNFRIRNENDEEMLYLSKNGDLDYENIDVDSDSGTFFPSRRRQSRVNPVFHFIGLKMVPSGLQYLQVNTPDVQRQIRFCLLQDLHLKEE